MGFSAFGTSANFVRHCGAAFANISTRAGAGRGFADARWATDQRSPCIDVLAVKEAAVVSMSSYPTSVSV